MQVEFTMPLKDHRLFFTATLIDATPSIEKFRVSVEGGRRTITVQGNRPTLIAKGSKKAITWKMKEGRLRQGNLLQYIFCSYLRA